MRPRAQTLLCILLLHAAPALAADIKPAVLQKGVYAIDSDDLEGICAAARKGCPATAKHAADDALWGHYYAAVCAKENKHKCVCEADVVVPELTGGTHAAEVNAAFKKIAGQYACSEGMAITRLRYQEPFSVAHIVSVKFDGYALATGGNGGCHSQALAVTANSDTGHVYALDEVLDKKQDTAIKNSIVAYFVTYFLETQTRANAERQNNALRVLHNHLDKNLWKLGFYLRDRQLFIDLNNPVLSCAEGPSFAIPIPREYITNKEILGVLR